MGAPVGAAEYSTLYDIPLLILRGMVFNLLPDSSGGGVMCLLYDTHTAHSPHVIVFHLKFAAPASSRS